MKKHVVLAVIAMVSMSAFAYETYDQQKKQEILKDVTKQDMFYERCFVACSRNTERTDCNSMCADASKEIYPIKGQF